MFGLLYVCALGMGPGPEDRCSPRFFYEVTHDVAELLAAEVGGWRSPGLLLMMLPPTQPARWQALAVALALCLAVEHGCALPATPSALLLPACLHAGGRQPAAAVRGGEGAGTTHLTRGGRAARLLTGRRFLALARWNCGLPGGHAACLACIRPLGMLT